MNPVEFEAYLAQFPNGVFRALAEARLAALRAPANDRPAAVGRPTGGVGSPGTGSRVSGAGGAAFGVEAGGDAPRRPGDVFRDCEECPEMVVMADGRLALGRYEVTVGEYRAFASATGGGAGGGCLGGASWRDPAFLVTRLHEVEPRDAVRRLPRTPGMNDSTIPGRDQPCPTRSRMVPAAGPTIAVSSGLCRKLSDTQEIPVQKATTTIRKPTPYIISNGPRPIVLSSGV